MEYVLIFVLQLAIIGCSLYLGFDYGKRHTLKELLKKVSMAIEITSSAIKTKRAYKKRTTGKKTTKVKSSKKK